MITNTAKPTTAFINPIRVSFGETWASIKTTWAAETRTWMATGSLFTNPARVTGSMTNTAKPS